MESCKLKVLEQHKRFGSLLLSQYTEKQRRDIFKFHRNAVYVQAVKNCKRSFEVVALNLCDNRDSATAGHNFSGKSFKGNTLRRMKK